MDLSFDYQLYCIEKQIVIEIWIQLQKETHIYVFDVQSREKCPNCRLPLFGFFPTHNSVIDHFVHSYDPIASWSVIDCSKWLCFLLSNQSESSSGEIQ